MKLRADHVVPTHNGGHSAAIFCGGNDLRGLGSLEVIGMDKIGVQTVFTQLDTFKHWMRLLQVKRIPTHMRNFQGSRRGFDSNHISLNPAQTLGCDMLQPSRCHQLHPDANAQKRRSPANNRLIQGRYQAGHSVQPVSAISKRTNAWQDDSVRAPDDIGITGDHNFLRSTAFQLASFKSFPRGVEITRTVINNDNAHISPR